MIDVNRDKEFYNMLGEYALNQLSDVEHKNFDSVVLELTIQPKAYGLTGHYFVNGVYKDLDYESPRMVIKELKTFHHESTKDGSSKWNKLVFTVTSDNKFNSELIWDEVRQAEVDKYNDEAEQEDPNYKRPKWPWEEQNSTQ